MKRISEERMGSVVGRGTGGASHAAARLQLSILGGRGTWVIVASVAICLLLKARPSPGATTPSGTSCGEEVTEFALSPDGSRIAALLAEPGSCGAKRRIAVVRISDPAVKTVYAGDAISRLAWADGRNLLFMAGRAASHLEMIDVDTRRTRVVMTAPGEITDYRVSPTGRDLLYMYRRPDNDEGWISKRVSSRMSVQDLALPEWARAAGRWGGWGNDETVVGVVRLAESGKSFPKSILYRTWFDVAQLAWRRSPARPMLLLDTEVMKAAVVDALTGKTIVNRRGLPYISAMAASPSGQIAVVSTGPADGRYMKRQGVYVVEADGHVHSVPEFSARRVSGIWWGPPGTLWLEPVDRRADSVPESELVEVQWRSGRILRVIRPPNGNLEGCQLNAAGSLAVCWAETLTSGRRLVRVDLASGAISSVAGLGTAPPTIDVAFQAIKVRNVYGRESVGFLAVPGAEPRRFGRTDRRGRIPLAVMLYGFNRTFAESGEWVRAYPVVELVHAGIAVLLLNFPEIHPWAFGNAAAARREFVSEPVSTVERAPAAVEAAGVPVGKVMVMGWSWGGLVASHVIEESCRFTAAEVGDPAYWNATGYGLYNASFRSFLTAIFGGPPDARFIQNYLDFRPIRDGQRPNGPVMLEFVGRNADVGEYLNELRAVGADVQAFAYHYSVHQLNVPEEARLARARNLAWDELNLLGPQAVPASVLRDLSLSVPAPESYRCHLRGHRRQ